LLAHQATTGNNLNAFVRDGPVAAHLLLRSGREPRIIVAFPAGNSGVGLWFHETPADVAWVLEEGPLPLTIADAKGRRLHGVKAIASVSAPQLRVKQAVLSNVRFLRDYEAIERLPPEVAAPMQTEPARLVFARDRIDGAAGYHLAIRVIEGRLAGDEIIAGASGRIRLEIVAASGDPPLTGIESRNLLNDAAGADPAARNALQFLSYREGFLAGSWRFNTYFGRDTLMSVRLLMPVLQPEAVEAGLSSVLARLNAAGEVAHEDGVSEFAIIERRRKGETGDAPTLDYAMIDDDFMLAPVMAAYLLDKAGPDRARAYLSGSVASMAQPGLSESVGSALVRNLRFVIGQARPFAAQPSVTNLIGLKAGRAAGQWRDSNDGLGGGRYAYDVNAVLAPAALEATHRLFNSGLLDPYLDREHRADFSGAGAMARRWRAHAPQLFRTAVAAREAETQVRAYAGAIGVPKEPALAALAGRDLTFNAIALDAEGRPIPILHSDEGFALLFSDPRSADVDVAVSSIMAPFPAGLMTDVGMLVANPALADASIEARFTPGAYHGTVIWSWQQALMAAGLERQLARRDLPRATRARLMRAQTDLWRAIETARAVQVSELWSWTFADGRYQVAAFGAGREDVDESNAAQLWSTVFLAVKPPPPADGPPESP
jgi:hypothetical protein